MRQVDIPEAIEPLGQKVQAPAPKPPPDQKVAEGIMRKPDGTLYTVGEKLPE